MAKLISSPASSIATKYAHDVVNGEIVACKLVIAAAQRHINDLSRKDIFYDHEEERRFVKFCGLMRHVQGPARGKPFNPAPFQVFIAGSVLCWKRKKTGLKRYTKMFAELGRKNAKTFVAGAIIAWIQIQKTSQGAEIYSAATTLNQASRVYQYLEKIFKSSPSLRSEFIFKYGKIWSVRTGAFLQNLAADHHKLDGLMPLVALGDEVHEWKGRGLYDVLDSSFGSTVEPLFLLVTSSGFNQDGIWWEERNDGISILKGETDDDSTFVYIATLDDVSEWDDPDMWIKANPGLGITKSIEYLEKKVSQARRAPGRKPGVLVKEMNFPTEAGTKWMTDEILDRNFTNVIDEESLRGRKCHGGIDLASTGDLAGYVLLFEPDEQGDRYQILPRFFVPQEKIRERSELDQAMYETWAEEGHIITTPGTVIDYDHIEAQISEDRQNFDVEGFGFDPWNASHIAGNLEKAGVNLLKFMQGKALGWCLIELEVLLENGRMNHGGHPVWLWMMKHAVLNQYNGIRWVDRKLSKGKIDGVIMTKIAIGKRMSGPSKKSGRGSIYDNQELGEY